MYYNQNRSVFCRTVLVVLIIQLLNSYSYMNNKTTFQKLITQIVATFVFIGVIGVNFQKPFGFFRESNAALVCINAEAWNQYPAIRQKGIPVNSLFFFYHQNSKDQLYCSTVTFGSAWISVPYYFFSLFRLSPLPVSIRIFSLCWLLFSLLSISLLTKSLVKYYQHQKILLPVVLILYLFTPAILWYNVQGYVHEVAVLPFYFLAWYFFVLFLQTKKINYLIALSTCIAIGIQFDWLPSFQALTMSIYLFLNKRKMTVSFAFLIPLTAIVIGVTYILYNYTNWAGVTEYAEYMKSKFTDRTVGAGKLNLIGFLNHNFNLFIFYILSAGILILVTTLALFKFKKVNPIILLITVSGLLHHLVFWGFSTEHDHAAIKMLFPFVFIAATGLEHLPIRKIMIAIAIITTVNIAQYFLLHNYPLRKGIYADDNYCMNKGMQLQKVISANDEMCFMNTDNKHYTQIEFYAKKYYTPAKDFAEAVEKIKKIKNVTKGCYVEILDNKISKAEHFVVNK